MPKKPHPADAFNDAVIAAAVWWSAFNQANGRVRGDHQTRAEAEAEARRLADETGRPSLVYAINREGRSALACTINPGAKESTMSTKKSTKVVKLTPKPGPAKATSKKATVTRLAPKTAKPKKAAAPVAGMPSPPDFSAKTHTRFRPKLAEVVALAEARDLAGLKAFHINPVSSSPKAIARYRDRVVAAIEGVSGMSERLPGAASQISRASFRT